MLFLLVLSTVAMIFTPLSNFETWRPFPFSDHPNPNGTSWSTPTPWNHCLRKHSRHFIRIENFLGGTLLLSFRVIYICSFHFCKFTSLFSTSLNQVQNSFHVSLRGGGGKKDPCHFGSHRPVMACNHPTMQFLARAKPLETSPLIQCKFSALPENCFEYVQEMLSSFEPVLGLVEKTKRKERSSFEPSWKHVSKYRTVRKNINVLWVIRVYLFRFLFLIKCDGLVSLTLWGDGRTGSREWGERKKGKKVSFQVRAWRENVKQSRIAEWLRHGIKSWFWILALTYSNSVSWTSYSILYACSLNCKTGIILKPTSWGCWSN